MSCPPARATGQAMEKNGSFGRLELWKKVEVVMRGVSTLAIPPWKSVRTWRRIRGLTEKQCVTPTFHDVAVSRTEEAAAVCWACLR